MPLLGELISLKKSLEIGDAADLVQVLNIMISSLTQNSCYFGSLKRWYCYYVFGSLIAPSHPDHPCATFSANDFVGLLFGSIECYHTYRNAIADAYADKNVLNQYRRFGQEIDGSTLAELEKNVQTAFARHFASGYSRYNIQKWISHTNRNTSPDLLRILLTEFREKMDWQTDRLFLQELWGNYENKMMSYFNWAENFAIVKRMHHVIRDIFPDRVAELAAGNRDSQLFLIFFQLFDPQFTLPEIIEFRKREKDTLLRLECVLSVLEFSEAFFLPEQYLKRLSLAKNVVEHLLDKNLSELQSFTKKLEFLISGRFYHAFGLLLRNTPLPVEMTKDVLEYLEIHSIHPESLATLLYHTKREPIAIPSGMTLAPALWSILAIFNSLGGKELVKPCRDRDSDNFDLSSSSVPGDLRQVVWDFSTVSQHSEELWSMDKNKHVRNRFGGMVIRSFLLLSLGIPFEKTVFSDGSNAPEDDPFCFEEYPMVANTFVDLYCMKKKTTAAVVVKFSEREINSTLGPS